MEFVATVTCTDKTIDVPISTLMRYEYFQKLFSNFSTKINHEKIQEPVKDTITKFTNIYTIPGIMVDCSLIVFLKLIRLEFKMAADPFNNIIRYSIEKQIYNKYNDEFFELLYYNKYYGTNLACIITNIVDNFGILEFVKSKLPNINVYVFLHECSLINIFKIIIYSYRLGDQGLLSETLILDLIEITCNIFACLAGKPSPNVSRKFFDGRYKAELELYLLGFMIKCCQNRNYKEKIINARKMYLTDQPYQLVYIYGKPYFEYSDSFRPTGMIPYLGKKYNRSNDTDSLTIEYIKKLNDSCHIYNFPNIVKIKYIKKYLDANPNIFDHQIIIEILCDYLKKFENKILFNELIDELETKISR